MPVPCCAAEPLLEVKISNFSAASSTSAGVPVCASGGVHFVPSSEVAWYTFACKLRKAKSWSAE
eukprot:4847399-Pyramimonas_sp.AAC.1